MSIFWIWGEGVRRLGKQGLGQPAHADTDLSQLDTANVGLRRTPLTVAESLREGEMPDFTAAPPPHPCLAPALLHRFCKNLTHLPNHQAPSQPSLCSDSYSTWEVLHPCRFEAELRHMGEVGESVQLTSMVLLQSLPTQCSQDLRHTPRNQNLLWGKLMWSVSMYVSHDWRGPGGGGRSA